MDRISKRKIKGARDREVGAPLPGIALFVLPEEAGTTKFKQEPSQKYATRKAVCAL
jgi:hypothetical protein